MPYVRTRGNQVLIVHGARAPETGQVEQRILFTLYSKEEALAAIEDSSGISFERMLADLHPDVRFEWKKIRKSIRANLGALPDTYTNRKNRVETGFRKALVNFTRELSIPDPQAFKYAFDLISSHRPELEHLRELIDWRLEALENAAKMDWSEEKRDDRFSWTHSSVGKEMPCEVEEMVGEKRESGDLKSAERLYQLYTEAFENYADGYLGLGQVALDRDKLQEAEARFKQAAETGRKLFPKRIAKSSYWSDHKTRPFLRALYSLVLTYNKMGRFDEALALCDRIEKEYDQDITADLYRANICLNQGKPELAFKAASRLIRLYPEQGFIAAWAAFESGRRTDADAYFLTAALNRPRAASMIVGRTVKSKPSDYMDTRAHNDAASIFEDCRQFLVRQSAASKKYFRALFDSELVQNEMKRLASLRKLQEESRQNPGPSPYYDQIRTAESIEHAKQLVTASGARGPVEFGRSTASSRTSPGGALVH